MRVASGRTARLIYTWEARLRAGLPFAFIALAAVSASTLPLAGAEAAPAKPESKAAAKAEYVGSETCQTCHEDIFKAFQKNPHAVVDAGKRKKQWEGKACESCHGPGSKHAESTEKADIIQPAKIRPAEADRNCLGCHLNQVTQVGRVQSGHAHNQVACVSCHSIHAQKENPAAGRSRAAELNSQCASCHPSVWAQFQRPYKHKLPEGMMSCVDCHNPHGSFLPKSVAMSTGNEPGCLKCHGNKRGPFTFDHVPVQMEGCGACHLPHGSANPKMLTRHEVRNLCLECHSNVARPAAPVSNGLGGIPPAIHDLRSPRYQNCTTCHQKIHGSYVSRGLLR